MNITLTIDEETLARARELAEKQGTSVGELIRSYLETLAVAPASGEILAELKNLWETTAGNSAGSTWTREELHERTGIH